MHTGEVLANLLDGIWGRLFEDLHHVRFIESPARTEFSFDPPFEARVIRSFQNTELSWAGDGRGSLFIRFGSFGDDFDSYTFVFHLVPSMWISPNYLDAMPRSNAEDGIQVLSSDHHIHVVREAFVAMVNRSQATDDGDGNALFAGERSQHVQHSVKFRVLRSRIFHGRNDPA